MSNTYGKVIRNWNPLDKIPIYPSQIQQVHHPFMINKTLDNGTEKYVGFFNQTLEYSDIIDIKKTIISPCFLLIFL